MLAVYVMLQQIREVGSNCLCSAGSWTFPLSVRAALWLASRVSHLHQGARLQGRWFTYMYRMKKEVENRLTVLLTRHAVMAYPVSIKRMRPEGCCSLTLLSKMVKKYTSKCSYISKRQALRLVFKFLV